MRIVKKRKDKSIYYLIISIISIIISYKYHYISSILSLISIILIIKYPNKKKLFLVSTIIISLSSIIINSIFFYNKLKESTDVYKNINILKGAWLYNENGGIYLFKEDNTYIQYTNEDTTNNYCQGTYNYKYGATKDDLTIRQDENYYYYTLTINEKKCYIMNKEFLDEYQKKMYFGYPKKDSNTITMVNTDNNNKFTLKKQ